MTNDDVLYAYRLRVLASARELGSVAEACRLYGIHRSTFYRWKGLVERFGSEILRPRERRHPQMPNSIPVLVEQRIVAFALGFPGYGPAHISGELRRPKWGGFCVSANGVWRVLRRHGISTPGRCDAACWPAMRHRPSRADAPLIFPAAPGVWRRAPGRARPGGA